MYKYDKLFLKWTHVCTYAIILGPTFSEPALSVVQGGKGGQMYYYVTELVTNAFNSNVSANTHTQKHRDREEDRDRDRDGTRNAHKQSVQSYAHLKNIQNNCPTKNKDILLTD